MIRTLVWKEYREHRGAWLVIALLGCLALLGISFISAPRGVSTMSTGTHSQFEFLIGAAVGIIIGAVMIYLVFAGGLLRGDLFPEFICAPDKGCGDFHGFVSNWIPKDPAANAKAIVWGFIAGFSERFVPNILNRLATDKEK